MPVSELDYLWIQGNLNMFIRVLGLQFLIGFGLCVQPQEWREINYLFIWGT